MEKNTETEIKLLLSEKDKKVLLTSSLVTGKTKKGSHKVLKLVSAYYDTRDLLLQQAGLAYRIRQTGKRFEAAIKISRAEAGSLTARQEYNVPVKGWKPDFSGFSRAGLEMDITGLLGTAQVEKLFSVRIRRDVRLLRVTKETLVEMAVDEGVLSANGKKERINEIELELKEGTLGDLLAYTAKIAALVPVFSEARSKYARGMALLGKLPEADRKSLPETDGAEDYSVEAKKIFYRCGAEIMAEQNVFGESRLQEEADRIFLPGWEKMSNTLYWIQPALTGSAGMETNLQGVLESLYRLRASRLLLRRWAELYRKAGGKLGNDKLSRLLEHSVRARGEEIRRKVLGGSYSAVIFSLWSVMERSAWKAEEYLQMKQLLQVRTREILDKVRGAAVANREKQRNNTGKLLRAGKASLDIKAGRGQEESYKLAARLEKDLIRLLEPESALKAAELGKTSRRRLEKLGEALTAERELRRLREAIPETVYAVKSAAGSRQAGFLAGVLSAEQAAAEKAVGRTFAKWLKTLE